MTAGDVDAIESLLAPHKRLFLQQKRELAEIFTGLETANQYAMFDEAQNQVGALAEVRGGVGASLLRWLLRSRRPLQVRIADQAGRLVLTLQRKWFWFFSNLAVRTDDGTLIGRVRRHFGLLYRKYDLEDARGRVFARIRGPLWRLWTFPVEGLRQLDRGAIRKRWSGGLRELFTDADTFMVDYGDGAWTAAQRAVILGAAISIDLDFFENNQG